MRILLFVVKAIGKLAAAVALAFLLLVTVTELAPVYRFRGPQPFQGLPGWEPGGQKGYSLTAPERVPMAKMRREGL